MTENSSGRSSLLVAAGIFLSRISGLLREVALAGFIGGGVAIDAFRTAMRIPNLLQNLFGEGALSASFIPVYSGLVESGEDQQARRLAGSVAGLLLAVTGMLAAAGVLLAGPLTSLIAAGLDDETHDLAVKLMRITTAGVGVLVLSAWCLGILNSHRRFFLSYVAPVLWNAAQIIALVLVGLFAWSAVDGIVVVAWAVLIGSLAQFAIQLPTVRGLLGSIEVNLDWRGENTRTVIQRFTPTLLGRGVVQISAFIDLGLASFLAVGAIGSLAYAQTLYLLPISLFAMSVAAAELPELSREQHDDALLTARADRGQRRIAFFLVFTMVAYFAVGDSILGALLERGKFTADNTLIVWFILGVMALGLPAVGSSRLLQNVLYAKGETRRPAMIAVVRVVVASVAGFALMLPFDQLAVAGRSIQSLDDARAAGFEDPLRLGAVGLAIGISVAAWTEFVLLTRLAARRVAGFKSPVFNLGALAIPASISFLLLAALKLLLQPLPHLLAAPLLLLLGGLTYTVLCFRRGVDESTLVLKPIRRLIWR